MLNDAGAYEPEARCKDGVYTVSCIRNHARVSWSRGFGTDADARVAWVQAFVQEMCP